MKPNRTVQQIMDHVDVFVPTTGSSLERTVKAGSGIVGSPAEDNIGVRVDFEGNVYNTPQLDGFADRVAHAAGRHVGRDGVPYPTVARAFVQASHLVRVGYFDNNTGEVVPEPAKKSVLERWLGHTVSNADLEAAGYMWEMKRALRRLEEEPATPEREVKKRFVEQQLAKTGR